MENQPLISIITVVFNAVKTIERTILSVIQQPYVNKEYIIIDGGSTDGTLEIIRKYEDRINKWVSEPDEGIFHAMNKGINLAHGELIGMINADDWYEPMILSEIATIYNRIEKQTIIHGLLRNFLNGQFYSIKGNSVHVLRYDMIQHPTCFIPKLIYQQYGLYDPRYKYSADYDLVLRYISRGIKFEFIEKIIANFSIGGVSSEGKAQKEKFHILGKHKVISKSEEVLRILLINCANLIKKVIHNCH
jgi:glycosyltransferase involved in cell wall biosynthesis